MIFQRQTPSCASPTSFSLMPQTHHTYAPQGQQAATAAKRAKQDEAAAKLTDAFASARYLEISHTPRTVAQV